MTTKPINSQIEELKKRMWSRMRNYTSDSKLLKRYMNDLNLIEKEKTSQFLEMLEKTKIIKDEFCQCGCSKKAHLPHQLDKNGGRCGICVHCDGYTWKGFEFVNLEPIKSQLTKGDEK